MDELHLIKKDFKLEWYSGSGAGGQHRNKHKNCCRITHIESGLQAIGTESKSRVSNQRVAFENLARMVLLYYNTEPNIRIKATEVIRNYHEPRNVVQDKASNFRQTYKKVVIDGYLDDMIKARKFEIGDENG